MRALWPVALFVLTACGTMRPGAPFPGTFVDSTRTAVAGAELIAGRKTVTTSGARCSERDTPRQCLRRIAAVRVNAVPAAETATRRDFRSAAIIRAATGDPLTVAVNLPRRVQLEAAFTRDHEPQLAVSVAPQLVRQLSRYADALAPARGEELGGIAWTSFDVPFATIVADAALRARVIEIFEAAVEYAPPSRAEEELSAFFVTAVADRRTTRVGATWEQGGSSFRARPRFAASLASDGHSVRSSTAVGTRAPRDGHIDVSVVHDTRARDRFLAIGTWTQRLTSRIHAPLSVVWGERTQIVPGACEPTRVSPPIVVCAPPTTRTQRELRFEVGLTVRFPPRTPARDLTPRRYCCEPAAEVSP